MLHTNEHNRFLLEKYRKINNVNLQKKTKSALLKSELEH